MTNDLETALRDMLRERAGDITTLPPQLTHLDRSSDTDSTELPDLGAPHRPARASRWLLAAAVALIIVIAGAVVGIRQLADHPQPATPNTVTPTSTPTAPTVGPTSPSPSPTPTTSTTADAAGVPLACKATLPHTWKSALSSEQSAYGAQSASPVQILPTGDMLVARDFGWNQPRDLALVSPDNSTHSVFQVPDPNDLAVQSADIEGQWLVVSVGSDPRFHVKGAKQGSSPMPNVRDLYIVNRRSGVKKQIASTTRSDGLHGGRTIDLAVVLGGKVYWDVRAKYTADRGVIKSYDLATGKVETAYSGRLGYIVGSVAGLGPNLDPRTVYVHASLPETVEANLSPDHPLSVATDGTAYAWEITPREIAWWAPGRSRPVHLRLHARLGQSADPTMLTVSGHFVMTVQDARLIDMSTGAVAPMPSAPRDAPTLISHGSVVAGIDSVGTGHWQGGYWVDPQPQVIHFDTSSLPGLHC